jgi:hypothetical protein
LKQLPKTPFPDSSIKPDVGKKLVKRWLGKPSIHPIFIS